MCYLRIWNLEKEIFVVCFVKIQESLAFSFYDKNFILIVKFISIRINIIDDNY